MVLSGVISCDLCNKEYRVRVGVGFDRYQRHYFDCFNCDSNIVFAIRAIAPKANMETVENCSIKTNNDGSDAEVVNFHPNCAFNENDLHNPFSFPSIELSNLIFPYMHKIEGRKIQSVSNQFDIPNAPNKWELIKGMLRFVRKDNKKAGRFVQQYMTQRNNDMNPKVDGVTFGVDDVMVYESNSAYPESYIIHEFFDSIFYPKISKIVRPIIDSIDGINKDSLSDLVNYWESEIKEQNQHRYLNTISDYFRFRDHFGQIVFYSRIDQNVDDLIVSSKGFEQIKLYYGDAYEALTSNMTVIAMLNNVLDGRKFDEFKSMTLSKYIQTNKSVRSNPFKSNPIFSVFAEDDIESSLRNGSHHASIWRDGEKVMYRSGGTGAQHDIPYSRYLDLCNRITIKLAAILVIEHYLSMHVKGSGYFICD